MATRTISDSGGTRNWNDTATWVEGSYPIAGDDVVATGTSGDVTVNVASACATMVLTNYVGTMTFNQNLTLTSTLTLAAGMGVAGGGSYGILLTGAATLTSAGKTWSVRLSFGAGATYTLADSWTVSGLTLTGVSGGVINKTSAETLTCSGGLNVASGPISGTATVILTGGTWSGNDWINSNLTINGNVTVSGTVDFRTGTLTYSSGTVTTTSSTLILGSNPTINTNGITWNIVRLGANTTITLSSLLSATTLQVTGTNTPIFAGAAGFTVGTMTSSTALDSNRDFTLQQGNTYTVTSEFSLAGTSSYYWTLKSSHATNLVTFTFSGSTQSVDYVKTTRIDSSGGNPIHDPHWVDNDPAHPTLNWDTGGGGGGLMWLA